MQSLLNRFIKNPHQLFLADGLGAFLTASFMFLLLAPFEAFFGMPSCIVYLLGGIAIAFFIFSLSCYFLKPQNSKFLLQLIAVANLLYSITTISICVIYYPKLTIWGLFYFSLELLVIGWVICIEMLVIRKIKF
jgi:hypothetical protein